MNLRIKPSRFIKWSTVIIVCLLFVFIGLLVINNLEAIEGDQPKIPPRNDSENPQHQTPPTRRKTYEELSLDGSKKITSYELGFNPSLFANNYTTYLDNNVIIAVTNIFPDVEREYYIFIGEDRTGAPHWINNNYVFFTHHCGSSCQGLTLLDVRTGQRWLAVLSFLSNKDGYLETHFHDWFDKDFKFNGSIQKIHGVMEDNLPYLIFDMENEKGVEIGEKRFLFTGNSLILKN